MIAVMNINSKMAMIISACLYAGACMSSTAIPQVLMITVLQTDDAELARQLLDNESATVAREYGQLPVTRTYGTESVHQPGDYLQVRVVDGHSAHISIGYRTPEVRLLWAEDTNRQVVPNVDLATGESRSGIIVQPELHGNEVLLKLEQYNDQVHSQYSAYGFNQNIRTVVVGSIGSWLDAGGTLELDNPGSANNTYIVQHNNAGASRLLIKVDIHQNREQ